MHDIYLHMLNGIHSGIPMCCIKYYMNSPVAQVYKWSKEIRTKKSKSVGYVRCLHCHTIDKKVYIKNNGQLVYRDGWTVIND